MMPIIVGIVVLFLTDAILSGPRVCQDGWASPSIGRQGACSHHGGVGGRKNGGIAGIAGIILGIGAGYITHQVRVSIGNKKSSTSGGQDERNQRTPNSPNVRPTPLCPTCGSRMGRRTARRGRNAGSDFFGCSRYPKCKGTRSIST